MLFAVIYLRYFLIGTLFSSRMICAAWLLGDS